MSFVKRLLARAKRPTGPARVVSLADYRREHPDKVKMSAGNGRTVDAGK